MTSSSDLGAVGGTRASNPETGGMPQTGSRKLGLSIASFSAPSTWFLINGGRSYAAIPLRFDKV
jgi:hypothetical protein